jgi:hypothetical protein
MGYEVRAARVRSHLKRTARGTPATKDAVEAEAASSLQGIVRGLQATAGNRAVVGMLSAQRQTRAPTRSPSAAERRGIALEQRMTQATQVSTRLSRQLSRAVIGGVGHVDAMLRDLGFVADQYQLAYQSYERVVAAGKAHAKAMDEMSDAVIGILIGVSVGLSLGAAFPAAAGARLAMNTAVGFRDEVAEALAGGAASLTGRVGAAGQPPSAEGLAAFEQAHPAMQRLRAYQDGARLYRELAMLSTRVHGLGDLDAIAAGLQADCRELALSGRHRSLSEAEITSRVQMVERDTQVHGEALKAIEKVTVAVEDARIAASLAKDDVDVRRMEHDIWIHWMASLSSDEAEILGSDPIEERLGQLGIMAKRGMMNAPERDWESTIGWGVGAWHSADNSREGARLAAKGSRALRMVGQLGTYRKHDEVAGRFTDSGGTVWSAVPEVGGRGSGDLEGRQVVVTRASPSGILLWVDLPAAAAEERRGRYTAQQLLGKTVTLTAIAESVWSTGALRYKATASSHDFPGRTWKAEMSPWHPGRPAEGASVVVMHVSHGILICRPQ